MMTPPSARGVRESVCEFAKPENLKLLRPVRLCGSLVKRAPALPITLRPDCLRVMLKHDVSRTMGQISSAETFMTNPERDRDAVCHREETQVDHDKPSDVDED
eukprot:6212389-Pleurochrysis_carterae.AAC.4